MGELLDPRLDQQHLQFTPALAESTRVEFLDHVEHLPDTLLANVYAPRPHHRLVHQRRADRQRIEADSDLDRAFRSRKAVSASYHKAEDDREEQKFLRQPRYLFIENYIPLFDSQGEQVMAMVEIYKEPPRPDTTHPARLRADLGFDPGRRGVDLLRAVLDRAPGGADAEPATGPAGGQ
ncbi:integral membrane sensor signal transduction histidine kinase [Pseudomonas putida]|nr:integral membrane sensor signal transduction histidine kinase [Pseudomonas putida]